jgi:NAD(P)-dependent dehydrogenase (short-subunit alcohol dehydrogenase family)
VSGRLVDRSVLVAGATGMAAAAAERLAAEGARVFVTARTEADCAGLVDRIRAAGGTAAYRAADLREEEAVSAVVAEMRRHYDRVDGVLHVAGGSGRRFGDGPVHEATLEGWEATIRLNLTTQFLVVRETVRTMLEQARGPGGRGSIVLMSSVLGYHPAPEHFATHAYAAAKGAIGSLVTAAAAYYAPAGIRVNGILPSLVTTPMSARAAEDPVILDYASRRQPLLGGFMTPEDVAASAVYLLADESRAVTGQLLRIDAGWSVSDADGWAGPSRAEAPAPGSDPSATPEPGTALDDPEAPG